MKLPNCEYPDRETATRLGEDLLARLNGDCWRLVVWQINPPFQAGCWRYSVRSGVDEGIAITSSDENKTFQGCFGVKSDDSCSGLLQIHWGNHDHDGPCGDPNVLVAQLLDRVGSYLKYEAKKLRTLLKKTQAAVKECCAAAAEVVDKDDFDGTYEGREKVEAIRLGKELLARLKGRGWKLQLCEFVGGWDYTARNKAISIRSYNGNRTFTGFFAIPDTYAVEYDAFHSVTVFCRGYYDPNALMAPLLRQSELCLKHEIEKLQAILDKTRVALGSVAT
jgi:hypothetical protein